MKTKRIISMLLAIIMLATVFSVGVSAETLTEVPEGYIGIYTKDDLFDVRLNMSGKYILMNDIVFDDADYVNGGGFYNSGKGWEPIGTKSTPFKGTFDGNGYDIVNLQINNPNGDYQGLFGFVNNATIKQVTIKDSKIIGKNYVGGIIGQTYQCQITNCSNAASVTGNNYVGGIVGYDNSEKNGNAYYFSKCINTGNIYAITGIASGLVGYGNLTIIRDCMNTGNISAKSEAAGISIYCKTIARCYSIGYVYGEAKSMPIGSVYGYYPEENFIFCYYLDSSVSDFSSEYSTAKSPDQLRRQGSFEQWDFTKNWEMCTEEYYEYPVPQGTKFIYSHVDVSGNAVYGETLTAKIENPAYDIGLYQYEWIVDSNTVGTEKTYTISKDDIDKQINVKVYLEDEEDTAMVSKKHKVTKAEQTNVPVPATLAGKADTSFSVNVTDGQEYSIDNENWNTTGEFTSLEANTEYTVFTRIAETDTHFASATDDSCKVTTLKEVINVESPTESENDNQFIYDNIGNFKTEIFDVETGESDGTSLVKIPVPTDFDAESVEVYFIPEDGTAPVEIEFTINDGFICFETTSSGKFAVVDKSQTVNNKEDNKEDNIEDNEEEKPDDCNCMCHKTGFVGFIWKIIRFIYKIFGTNHICKCGIAHW